MANPFFKFKQFTVFHDKCAMKVGTDGVLIGAWAEVTHARRVLDIGTGTGLIALMIAQRCRAKILAVDIDKEAVEQARENVLASPWSERIEVIQEDVKNLSDKYGGFDVIVSNPPYFVEDVKCPAQKRNAARHTDGLSFPDLLRSVSRLLSPEGCFSVILPSAAATDFIGFAISAGLHLYRRTWVHTKPGFPPKRVLMTFRHKFCPEVKTEHLVIELERNTYSSEFTDLLKDYYLAMN